MTNQVFCLACSPSHFSLLACLHLIIYIKHKVQQRPIRISLVLLVFGHKPNEYYDLMMAPETKLDTSLKVTNFSCMVMLEEKPGDHQSE